MFGVHLLYWQHSQASPITWEGHQASSLVPLLSASHLCNPSPATLAVP